MCFYNAPSVSPYFIKADKVVNIFEEIFNLGKLHDYVLIGGDLDLQHIDWDTRKTKNELDKPLLGLLEGHDLNQIIDFPTAASEILDLILVNHNIEVISCKPSNAKINSFQP